MTRAASHAEVMPFNTWQIIKNRLRARHPLDFDFVRVRHGKRLGLRVPGGSSSRKV